MRKALVRLWGRDVMLYTGGVSFFACWRLPGLAILIGLYSLLADPAIAVRRAQCWPRCCRPARRTSSSMS